MDCSVFKIGDIAKTENNSLVRVSFIEETPFVMSVRFPLNPEFDEYKYDINGVSIDDSPLGNIIEKVS